LYHYNQGAHNNSNNQPNQPNQQLNHHNYQNVQAAPHAPPPPPPPARVELQLEKTGGRIAVHNVTGFETLGVTFELVNAACKRIPGRDYDPGTRRWTFPETK
jgi:hypothetical protein